MASPDDALSTFSRSDLDMLVIGSCVVRKGQLAPDGPSVKGLHKTPDPRMSRDINQWNRHVQFRDSKKESSSFSYRDV